MPKQKKKRMQMGGQVGIRPDVAKLKMEEEKQLAAALADKQGATAVKPYQYKQGGRVQLRTKGTGAATKGLDFYGFKD